jgi:hypothetical protein
VARKNLGSHGGSTAGRPPGPYPDGRPPRRSALVLAACSGDQSALAPAGPFAERPHDLILWVFGIAVVVFVLVQGLILYTSFRYRRREGDDSMPEQVHGNTKLEIVWTLIPAMILAAIAVPTVQLIFEQMDEPDVDFLTVEVIGHRWWFEYYYPDYDIYTANEMAIPVGDARSPRDDGHRPRVARPTSASSTRSGSRGSPASRTSCRGTPPT